MTNIEMNIFFIFSIAVYKLLLRKGLEFSSFCKVGTLEGTNGGESPACSAISLVFDRGDSTSLNQAEISGRIGLKIGQVEVGDLVKVLDFTFFTLINLRSNVTKDGRVLFECPV